MTETPAATRRGRPRPQLTLERDRRVADVMAAQPLDQSWTKAEIAEATGLDEGVVYHCLNRLTWSGVVVKTGRGTYQRTAKAYTPEYDEALRPTRGAAAE